jgi:hypothetical protein
MAYHHPQDWKKWSTEDKHALLERLTRGDVGRILPRIKAKYRNDPAGFVRDCFNFRPHEKITDYQSEIMAGLVEYKRVAVRGPHGPGKTTIAAWLVIWFACTRDGEDWKVLTTAGSWRQLTKFLWPECHKWIRRLKWDVLGRGMFDKRTELLGLSLRLATGEAFALASNDAELIEGAHADCLLYIADEGKAISPATFDAIEGAFSGGDHTECFAFTISTPGEPAGRFYDIHARKPGFEDWHVRHVTLSEAIKAGRVSGEWAEQRKKQWGEQSAVYQNRVLGEFCASDADGVIPLSWVETANERWEKWNETKEWFPFTCIAADIARSLDGDKTILALRFDKVISELRRYTEADVMLATGRIAGVLSKTSGRAVVDVIGVGAGVVDRLREQKFKVDAFNASESADGLKDRSGELGFINQRSAAWWNFRELLDPANGEDICIPPDDLLTGDLISPHWRVTSSGKIQVESKDDIHRRLKRSTDDGDAVVMAFSKRRDRGSWKLTPLNL